MALHMEKQAICARLFLIFWCLPLAAQQPASPATRAPVADFGRIPLTFEANEGQAAASTQFLSSGADYTLSLSSGGSAVLEMRTSRHHGKLVTDSAPAVSLRFSPVDADPRAAIQPSAAAKAEDQQITRSNYFAGNDPARWHTNIPNYSHVRYSQIFPGIDLVYYGHQGHIEHDFVVAPGANPARIALAIDGAASRRIDPATGDLVLTLPSSAPQPEVRLLKPVTYQEIKGHHTAVASSYRLLANNRIAFRLGRYDRHQPLIIDPGLSYSTFATMVPTVIAVDPNGNAYLAGGTTVEAVNAGGSALIYKTTLADANILAIAADQNGQVYLTGNTTSTSFPTVNPIQTTLRGTQNAFITKLNAAGSALTYSTYLGGTGTDSGAGIGIDIYHRVYVAGSTTSTDFPTLNALQGNLLGQQNTFVTALVPAGTSMIYSTYLGGEAIDTTTAITLDPEDNVFLTGYTTSADFPTLNPIQSTNKAFPDGTNAFIAGINPTGSALNFSTYLGGSATDTPSSIAIDPSKNVYIAGTTTSTDFPVTTGAYDTTYPGDTQAGFVAKITTGGAALGYATYLGGSIENPDANTDNTYPYPPFGSTIAGVAVNAAGNALVYGGTYDTDFPTTSGAFQTTDLAVTNNGELSACNASDTFLTELDPAGASLVYSTYFGGKGPDGMYRRACGPGYFAVGIALDPNGNAYLAGNDTFGDTPITQYALLAYGDSGGGFVAKFAYAADSGTTTTLQMSPNPQKPGAPVTFTAKVTANPSATVTGTITFNVAPYSSAPIKVPSSGIVTYTVPSFTKGDYGVYAVYSGAINFAASVGTGIEVVNIAATPYFSPAAGTYASSRSVSIIDASAQAIYYTTNGSTPTTSSTIYTGPITVSSDETIKAIAIESGHFPSEVASALYTIEIPTGTPIFSVNAGTYASPHTVTITDRTGGAVIYYTTDGSRVSTSSPQYAAPITIDKDTLLQAFAVAPGHNPSPIESAQYLITAATPVFSLKAGSYTGTQSVTITDTSTGSPIYYTTDGSTPTTSSTKYTVPVKVTSSETIKAIADGNGYVLSKIASAAYVIK